MLWREIVGRGVAGVGVMALAVRMYRKTIGLAAARPAMP